MARGERSEAEAGSVPWRDVPSVVRLTAAIGKAFEAAGRAEIERAVAIGRQIAEVKRLLPYGEFLRWASEAVPLAERTVQRWLLVAELAEAEPQELKRFAHLGLTKMYRVAALGPSRRGALRLRTPIRVPGTTEKKTIEVMTARELDRVIGGLATPPVPTLPVEKIVRSFRFRLAGLSALTEILLAREDIDERVIGELVAELHGLAQTIDRALER